MGEWEEGRRNNFVHLKKSFFQIIFDKVRERTWLGSSPCAASGGNARTSLDVCCGRRYDRNILIWEENHDL